MMQQPNPSQQSLQSSMGNMVLHNNTSNNAIQQNAGVAQAMMPQPQSSMGNVNVHLHNTGLSSSYPYQQQQQQYHLQLSDGMNALDIDPMDDAASSNDNDGQRKSPPPEYVEDVTVSRDIEGTVKTIIVTKPRAESSLGITFSDSNDGEVKISDVEDGSPMSGAVDTGMTVLAINDKMINSRDKFGEIYDPCLGKVEIKVGPKNMKEAVTIIETLDLKKKDLEDKNEGLEVALKVAKERREKDVASLNLEKEGLDKDNQVLKVNVQELEGQVQHLRAVLIDKIRQKNKQLAEQVNLD